jgi:putative ABC transport system ATP-binding protein
MASIRLENIVKRYGAFTGVQNMSLDIADEEFLVLLGPSGCGKTTTMRMIAGLEMPTEGSIIIGGEVVNDIDARDRDVAMVFQGYALYPNMTVYENISFPLRIRGTPKAEIHPAVMKASGKVELDDFLQRRPKELSGGQRQRVAVARALVNNPSIILADEPTGNLDTKTSVEIMGLLEEIHSKGNTIILVTHEEDIAQHAHRIVRMRDGLIENDYLNENVKTVSPRLADMKSKDSDFEKIQ